MSMTASAQSSGHSMCRAASEYGAISREAVTIWDLPPVFLPERCFKNTFVEQRKVPHPYSRGDEGAHLLTGFGMTKFAKYPLLTKNIFETSLRQTSPVLIVRRYSLLLCLT